MPHSHGYRSHTRSMFSRQFRKHGAVHTTTLLRTYRVGDYVDIKANGAIHRGMPHRFYHGKTGIVFDVTAHAVGVQVNKFVNGRIIPKRIHVRTEHVNQSKCRLEFLKRVKENDIKSRNYKASGSKPENFKSCKRAIMGPIPGHSVKSGSKNKAIFMRPIPYDTLI